MQMEFDDLACNLCGRRDHKIKKVIMLGGLERSNIVECCNCSLRYLSPMPKSTSLGELYSILRHKELHLEESVGFSPEESDRNSSYVNERYRDSLLALRKLSVSSGRLLDVGADEGDFLALAKKQGFDGSGVEVSAEAAARAKQKYGLELDVSGQLQQLPYACDHFDIVTMSAILEHLIDPMQALREINRVMRPNGLLILLTDNDDSVYQRIGRFFNWLKWSYEDHFGKAFFLERGNRSADLVIRRSFRGGIEVDQPADASVQGVNEFLLWMFQHVHYFTFGTLKAMLSESGFKIIKYPVGAVCPSKSWKHRLLLYNQYANKLFKLFNMQMNLFVVAQKVK